MLLSAYYVMPITSEPIENGAVLVRNGKIYDVGKADMMRLRYPEEQCRDYGKSVLMPGFVDVHCHMDGSALRGVVHDVPYSEWRSYMDFGREKLTPSDKHDSAMVGCLEAIASGITTLADISSNDATVDAMQVLGMRGVAYREVCAMDKSRVDHAMRVASDDLDRWAAKVDSGRIFMGIAPAAPFRCNPLVYRRCSDFAGSCLRVAMHLAGSREEYNFVRYGSSPFSVHGMDESCHFVECPPWLPTGVTPVKYALNWGAFEAENTMAINCVYVNDEDLKKLKQYNVSVALAPRANCQLGMGVAPMDEFLRMGFRVGLGTDSPAATDSIDMFANMRTGMLIQRALHSGQFLSATTMLEMGTMGGARALWMDHRIGSLEVGKYADIIAVDISKSHLMPTSDVASAVVNSASSTDVIMTMVGGKVLYEDQKWEVGVDVDAAIDTFIKLRKSLRSKLSKQQDN